MFCPAVQRTCNQTEWQLTVLILDCTLETQGALPTPHAWVPPQRFQCNWREDLEITSSRVILHAAKEDALLLTQTPGCGEVQEGTAL